MSNKRYQGKIVRWQDERGFGFIQTNGSAKDIFLHISAIQRSSRRPQVGDTIYFDLKQGADGKYKAVNASFTQSAPVPPRKTASQNRTSKRNLNPASPRRTSYQRSRQPSSRSGAKTPQLLNAVIIGLLLVGVGVAVPKFLASQSRQTATSNPNISSHDSTSPRPEQSLSQADSQPTQDCNIKGNISYPDGEKFYHKPGYQDYDKVEIFENEGERWFCSAEEAVRAGWKDAAAQ